LQIVKEAPQYETRRDTERIAVPESDGASVGRLNLKNERAKSATRELGWISVSGQTQSIERTNEQSHPWSWTPQHPPLQIHTGLHTWSCKHPKVFWFRDHSDIHTRYDAEEGSHSCLSLDPTIRLTGISAETM
jgi:hypothetical protein